MTAIMIFSIWKHLHRIKSSDSRLFCMHTLFYFRLLCKIWNRISLTICTQTICTQILELLKKSEIPCELWLFGSKQNQFLRKKRRVNIKCVCNKKTMYHTQYWNGSYQERDDSSCAYRPQHCFLLIAQNPQAILEIQNSPKIYIP